MLAAIAQRTLPVLRRSRSAEEGFSSDADKRRAIDAVKNEDSPASALLVAMRMLFSNQCLAWEPESFWVACEVEHSVDVPVANRAKFMAALTLILAPRFYSDANVYEKTCLAFNDVVPIPDAINEASPAQLAWGTIEAELIMQSEGQEPEFDYEPARYAATSMAHDGLLVAPGALAFAQSALNEQARSPQEDTIRAVHQKWEELSKDSKALRNYAYDNNPVDVQLAKLASIELYIQDKAARYQDSLTVLL